MSGLCVAGMIASWPPAWALSATSPRRRCAPPSRSDRSRRRRWFGHTTFASQLACAVDVAGRPAIVVHEDDFLAPRAVRYRRGRESPEGFFHDSYDLGALIRHVVDPLRPGGDRRIRRRMFDHGTDAPVETCQTTQSSSSRVCSCTGTI